MNKIFCVGLVVVDVPLRPVSGAVFSCDSVRIESPVWATGGDATNVAVTLKKLGVAASLCALVGNDGYGDFVVERLTTLDIDLRSFCRHPTLPTSVSHILIEPEGERHFLLSGMINSELSYRYVKEELIDEADIVYLGSAMYMCGMDEGGSAALFKRAHRAGKLTAADFGGGDAHDSVYWLHQLEPMLYETDILLPSYREAKTLTGKTELSDIRSVLSVFGAKLLIVKLGSKGCYLTDFKDEWYIPTFSEFKPVDTTGAGDSFVGGFLRGLLEGWSPENAAVFANVVASHNVTRIGATGGVPDFETAYTYVVEHTDNAARFPLKS
ncbi:MAG: carbohydrate kinase family protein [Treponema sp.]|jgi:sugar/nucleoside kinase (ribokinase family)|nr:carbohydrate kinase family protein [Treponema sp.]